MGLIDLKLKNRLNKSFRNSESLAIRQKATIIGLTNPINANMLANPVYKSVVGVRWLMYPALNQNAQGRMIDKL